MGSANQHHLGEACNKFIDGMRDYSRLGHSQFGRGPAAMAEIEARTILGQRTDLSDVGSVCKAILEVAGKPNIPSDQTGVYGFLREYVEFLQKSQAPSYAGTYHPQTHPTDGHRQAA